MDQDTVRLSISYNGVQHDRTALLFCHVVNVFKGKIYDDK